jgi:hypothetical protein
MPTATLKKGETLNSLLLNVGIVKNSKEITQVRYYKNNNLIHTNYPSAGATSDYYIDGSTITTDSTYKVSVYDGTSEVFSSDITIYFVNSFYYGVVNTFPPTVSNVLGLTEDKTAKENKKYTFNATEQIIVVAYPSAYGDLKYISSSSENLGGSFVKSVLYMNNENYNIYFLPNNVFVTGQVIEFDF